MLAAAQEAGDPPPPAVLVALDLWPVCLPYQAAWQALGDSRGWVGTGDGALAPLGLSYSETAAYARDHGLATSRADLEDTVVLIRAQDAVWVEWYRTTHLSASMARRPARG